MIFSVRFSAFLTLLTGWGWAGNPNPRLVKAMDGVYWDICSNGYFVAGSELYFTANDGSFGRGLWKTDGTEAGTVPLKGGFTGISEYVSLGSSIFFSATDATGDAGLWKTTGTAAGTVRVKGGWGGASASPPKFLVAFNGQVYFRAGTYSIGSLWKSNGTEAGTVQVKANWDSHPSGMTVMGNAMYFQATEAATGGELWKSDGTASGTVLLKDIAPASGSSYPGSFIPIGNTLFFVTGWPPYQLWKTNGTASSTVNLGATPNRSTNCGIVVAFFDS